MNGMNQSGMPRPSNESQHMDGPSSEDVYRFVPFLQGRFSLSAEDDFFADCDRDDGKTCGTQKPQPQAMMNIQSATQRSAPGNAIPPLGDMYAYGMNRLPQQTLSSPMIQSPASAAPPPFPPAPAQVGTSFTQSASAPPIQVGNEAPAYQPPAFPSATAHNVNPTDTAQKVNSFPFDAVQHSHPKQQLHPSVPVQSPCPDHVAPATQHSWPSDPPAPAINQEVQKAVVPRSSEMSAPNAYPSEISSQPETPVAQPESHKSPVAPLIQQNKVGNPKIPAQASSTANPLTTTDPFQSLSDTSSVYEAIQLAQGSNRWAEAFCLASTIDAGVVSSVRKAFCKASTNSIHPMIHWHLRYDYLHADSETVNTKWKECMRLVLVRQSQDAHWSHRLQNLVNSLISHNMPDAAAACQKAGSSMVRPPASVPEPPAKASPAAEQEQTQHIEKQVESMQLGSAPVRTVASEAPPVDTNVNATVESSSSAPLNTPLPTTELNLLELSAQVIPSTTPEAAQPVEASPSTTPVMPAAPIDVAFMQQEIVLQAPVVEVPAQHDERTPTEGQADPSLSLEIGTSLDPADDSQRQSAGAKWWPFPSKQRPKEAILPDDAEAPQFNAQTGKWESAAMDDDGTDFDLAVQNGPPMGDGKESPMYINMPGDNIALYSAPAVGLGMRYADSFNF